MKKKQTVLEFCQKHFKYQFTSMEHVVAEVGQVEADKAIAKFNTPKKNQSFYIGERGNPQLKNSYFKAYGQLSKTDAKAKEKCSYGTMTLECFDNEVAYNAKIQELKVAGKKFV